MATDDVLGPPPYLRSKWWYLQDAPNVAPTTIGPAPESLTADSTTREITAFYLQHALNQYHTIDECKRLIDERQTKTAILLERPISFRSGFTDYDHVPTQRNHFLAILGHVFGRPYILDGEEYDDTCNVCDGAEMTGPFDCCVSVNCGTGVGYECTNCIYTGDSCSNDMYIEFHFLSVPSESSSPEPVKDETWLKKASTLGLLGLAEDIFDELHGPPPEPPMPNQHWTEKMGVGSLVALRQVISDALAKHGM